jgi:hypothetical protein
MVFAPSIGPTRYVLAYHPTLGLFFGPHDMFGHINMKTMSLMKMDLS